MAEGKRQARSVRVQHRCAVEFASLRQGVSYGETEDVSVSGLRVRTNAPREAGTTVSVRVQLPTGRTEALRGTVVWSNALAMGVQFESVDMRYLRFLAQHGPRRVAPGVFAPPVPLESQPAPPAAEPPPLPPPPAAFRPPRATRPLRAPPEPPVRREIQRAIADAMAQVESFEPQMLLRDQTFDLDPTAVTETLELAQPLPHGEPELTATFTTADGVRHTAAARELKLDSLQLSASELPTPGVLLDVATQLPDGTPVQLRGRLVTRTNAGWPATGTLRLVEIDHNYLRFVSSGGRAMPALDRPAPRPAQSDDGDHYSTVDRDIARLGRRR